MESWERLGVPMQEQVASEWAAGTHRLVFLRLEQTGTSTGPRRVAILRDPKTELEFVLVPGHRDAGVPCDAFALERTELPQRVWLRWMDTSPGVVEFGVYDDPEMPLWCASPAQVAEFARRTELDVPTESEWSHALNLGVPERTRTDAARIGRIANLGSPGRVTDRVGAPGRLARCGSLECDAIGLFDMIGNVCEFVTRRDAQESRPRWFEFGESYATNVVIGAHGVELEHDDWSQERMLCGVRMIVRPGTAGGK